MKSFCVAVVLLTAGTLVAMPQRPWLGTRPPPEPEPDGVLRPGSKVELRVRQVIPIDGLSRGERMLSGHYPLHEGDVFTAELPGPLGQPAMILAGRVGKITPPRLFGLPGKAALELAWPLTPTGTQPEAWKFNLEDQRFTSGHRRRTITTLFMAEGFALGASVGSTIDRGKTSATLAAGGVGILFGLAYASLQPGHEALLEPGDTISVVVGATKAKKLPPEVPLNIYPADEPEHEKHKKHHKKGEKHETGEKPEILVMPTMGQMPAMSERKLP